MRLIRWQQGISDIVHHAAGNETVLAGIGGSVEARDCCITILWVESSRFPLPAKGVFV